MKKHSLIIAFLVLIFCHQVYAEQLPDNTDYDIFKHQKLAMNILLGWSGVSIAVGTGMIMQSSKIVRDFGIQNTAWGAIDASIAIYANYFAKKKDPQNEQRSFRRILLVNTLLDVLYIGAGATLAASGKDKLKGHGYGVIIQGAFLFLLDGINFFIIPKV